MAPARRGEGPNASGPTAAGDQADAKAPVPAQGQKESTTANKARELDPSEQHEVQRLAARDREVRAHEAAHMAAGGALVRGGMQLDYERGPDGALYAVGGEVSIETGEEKTPEATLRKAETIRNAALAPANPSSQDRAVAAVAAQMAATARQELSQQQLDQESEPAASRGIERYQAQSPANTTEAVPSIDEFV